MVKWSIGIEQYVVGIGGGCSQMVSKNRTIFAAGRMWAGSNGQ